MSTNSKNKTVSVKSLVETKSKDSVAKKSDSNKPGVKKVVLVSKAKPKPNEQCKSCSMGGISSRSKLSSAKTTKTKKVTQSDLVFSKKVANTQNKTHDLCAKCGDTKSYHRGSIYPPKPNYPKIIEEESSHTSGDTKNDCIEEDVLPVKKNSIQQYFKNENFTDSAESLLENNLRKTIHLDTIKEQSETRLQANKETIYKLQPQITDEPVDFIDPNSLENIKKLKKFRDKNFFECHSARARITSQVSATANAGHKCSYRFYLNERLFPVPISSDHQNNIRCVECLLPYDETKDQEIEDSTLNGTIQAKVTINGDNVQDMTLLLPVKKNLIMRERRKQEPSSETTMFFGVVKLNANGNSIFNPTLPENSLALKYQKGFHLFDESKFYKYERVPEEEVIVI